ncbi:DUF3962 domain-containing protein [Bacillus clarus]|uniref:DUF3962 domain-containing protein n=1 Tax=Bacillus clarus TaxID=2338372 RepID=A0A090Z4C2_9BACI|nr:DUF3962 domain-containing protein [Bacillus clarus]KFM99255.1 hypothetical protein DJ93_5112 [Bacillus clarus]RFT64380.1 DUF3962 domain-containing protein [Bacillus clarus]
MEKLQLLAFKNVIEPLMNERLSYVHFPAEWFDIIEIHYKTYVLINKLKRLNDRLYDMFSDILFIRNNPFILTENTPWIVSKEPLKREQLDYICRSWYAIIHDWKPTELPQEIELEWGWDLVSNLLPLHDKKSFSKWVPALIAHIFCEHPLHISIPNSYKEELSFYPLRSKNICEAMSEPIKQKETQEYFSYVYRFEIITRGTENIPLLKVSLGIRRFYQKSNRENLSILLKRKKGTLLVAIREPFTSIEETNFVKLKIESGQMGIRWAREYRKLRDVFIVRGDLELGHIIRHSKRYIEGKDIRVLLAYNENTFQVQGTKIKLGISSREKEILFQEFRQIFPCFKLLSKCEKLQTNSNNHLLPLYAPKGLEEITLEVWSNGLAIEIERILFESKIIVGKREDTSYVLNTTSPVILKIVKRSVREIIENPYKMEFCHKYKERCVQKVVEGVQAIADHANETILSIIIMEKCDGREKIDPKQVIREGFARTKRISTFIELLADKGVDCEQVLAAVLSLLEQRGFLTQNWNKINLPGIFVSLSIEKMATNQFLPVFSKINEKEILYKLYNRKEWKKIDHTLLNVDNYDVFLPQPSQRNDKRTDFDKFVREELLQIAREAQEKNVPIYFIIDASVGEYWVKGLQKNQIDLNVFPELEPALKSLPNFKIIRINKLHDIPNYIFNQKDYHNKNHSGLFLDPQGMYYSADTNLLKSTALLQQNILEIIILGAQKEERDDIARMVHYMCKMSMRLEKSNLTPYSMQMIKLIKTYITDFELREYKDSEDELDEDIMTVESEKTIVFV